MKKTELVLSDAAVADILEQADWYELRSGKALARQWERAVTTALSRAMNRPASGPMTVFRSSELEGVRRMKIPGFPRHLLFYKVGAKRNLCSSDRPRSARS